MEDPRVMVRLGAPITGYGVESRSRSARQRIRHRDYTDAAGVQHLQARTAAGPADCSCSCSGVRALESGCREA